MSIAPRDRRNEGIMKICLYACMAVNEGHLRWAMIIRKTMKRTAGATGACYKREEPPKRDEPSAISLSSEAQKCLRGATIQSFLSSQCLQYTLVFCIVLYQSTVRTPTPQTSSSTSTTELM